MNPFMKDAKLIPVKRTGPVVILERVEPGVEPDYCTHGKATCFACDEWVWLGDQTYQVVATGRYMPLCQQCGIKYIPKDAGEPIGRVEDHRRADGPH